MSRAERAETSRTDEEGSVLDYPPFVFVFFTGGNDEDEDDDDEDNKDEDDNGDAAAAAADDDDDEEANDEDKAVAAADDDGEDVANDDNDGDADADDDAGDDTDGDDEEEEDRTTDDEDDTADSGGGGQDNFAADVPDANTFAPVPPPPTPDASTAGVRRPRAEARAAISLCWKGRNPALRQALIFHFHRPFSLAVFALWVPLQVSPVAARSFGMLRVGFLLEKVANKGGN